jgi:peptide/nickel transport system substrate-binding protein
MSKLQKLEEMFNQGKISRRDFLERAAVLAGTAALSTTFWNRSALASTPKKGGRLRLGLGGGHTTDSLDPALIEEATAETTAMGLVYNYLVEVDRNGEAIPELAESWESTPDARQWVFRLRKGVEFHNGKTLDAEDVVFSINHHRKEGSKSAAKSIVDPIREIRADGKHTVVVTLREGNADFPFLMSDYHLGIIPAGTSDVGAGIGTGGYILQTWEPGVRVFATRNPAYWKADRAHFDEVEILVVNDLTARTNAMKTGHIDAMNRVGFKTAHLLKKSPGIRVLTTTGAQHYTLPMHTDVAPYDNNDVRLALKYAINREQMVDLILQGYGSVGNDHPIAPFQRFFAEDLPQREYDPDKAKFHLKKSGVEGHTFSLHVANVAFEGAVDAAILYKEQAAKAGIEIEVIREPNDGYWSSVWLKKPWCACYWYGRPTEDWMFTTVYAADAKWNDTRWEHDRFNKLLKEARAELDREKRHQMYTEMQAILRDEGGAIIPMFAQFVEAVSEKLAVKKVAANAEMDGFRAPERWWFEA